MKHCCAEERSLESTAIVVTPVKVASVTPLSLNAFLANAERRAYRMALFAAREPADALDIVQDAMYNLVKHYGDKPSAEWPLLFQRILQNRILEWHRSQTRSRRWFVRWFAPENEDEEDPLALIEDPQERNPEALLSTAGDIEIVQRCVQALPVRQQQAFLLRAWEGLDVADTAAAMQCSEGSVKTHYFRALQALRSALASTPMATVERR